MRFTFTEEQEDFRQDLCDFLTRELTPEVSAENHDPGEFSGYKPGFTRTFRKKLAERGYLGVGWPEEYGGGGKDMVYQVLIAEEMEYHNAPGVDRSITYVPQAIIAYGTKDQKEYFLPRLAAGELEFFIGYSEPEAGSDLASLSMRAVADGDEFILNGQKAFSSDAHHCDYGFVAARTDPEAPKHRGISLFIVDLKTHGITLGGFTTISGWHHPTVAFDDVRVPRSGLIGEVNLGWQYIMGAIDYERAAIGNPGLMVRTFDRLVDYCQTTYRERRPLLEDPVISHRLAELRTEVEAARLLSYWVASMHARGLNPQHETSLVALTKRETVRAMDSFALEVLGPVAQLRRGDPLAPSLGGFEYDYKNNLYFHFAAGGMDITRNVIARRGLKMPRD